MSGRLRKGADAGYTLVELLVAMVVMGVLITVAMATVVNSQEIVTTSKQLQDINEEARQAVNRMARDIRQATRVVTAVNPDGPAYDATAVTAVRFESDFDGDGCISGTAPTPTPSPAPTCKPYDAGNPEDITYCFQPGVRQLYVIDNEATSTPVTSSSTSCDGGQPLLAGNVIGFVVEYRSNQYRHDLNPSDGITTWRELDAALPPVGDGDGELGIELADVDSVVINVRMELAGRTQDYRTQVDLRNRSK
jgi:prepilin-type N-terminal cleavage/methylation domain-containing protein